MYIASYIASCVLHKCITANYSHYNIFCLCGYLLYLRYIHTITSTEIISPTKNITSSVPRAAKAPLLLLSSLLSSDVGPNIHI